MIDDDIKKLSESKSDDRSIYILTHVNSNMVDGSDTNWIVSNNVTHPVIIRKESVDHRIA